MKVILYISCAVTWGLNIFFTVLTGYSIAKDHWRAAILTLILGLIFDIANTNLASKVTRKASP